VQLPTFFTDKTLINEIIYAGASVYLLVNTTSAELITTFHEIKKGTT